MTLADDLERELGRWMEASAPPQAPDDLARAVAARTAAIRPRPRWLARLMEPTMDTTLSLRRSRYTRRAAVLLGALLLASLLVGSLVVGGKLLQTPPLPAPFGVAGNGLLAADVDGAIELRRADGTAAGRLDLPFASVSSPSFSRDGSRIAVWAFSGPPRPLGSVLVIATVDGSGSFAVQPGTAFIDPSDIAWSPDGQQVAFSDMTDQLYIADIAARRIAAVGDDAPRREPAWSPDGRLAYRCARGSVLHLCVSDGDGTDERVMPTTMGTLYAFQGSSWSNDGSRIAYYINDVDGSGGWDVATIDVATGTEHILTRMTPFHMIYPTWSTDDRYIIANTGGPPAVVSADGTTFRVLGEGEVGESACKTLVAGSPDGRYVTCLMTDHVLLLPIEGGEPISVPLGGSAQGLSFQRITP